MSLLATIGTVERILMFAGPLVTTLVGEGNKETAEKVIDAAEAALRYARMGIDGAEDFAEELEAIAIELEAMKAAGGPGEADFDGMADRVADKTAKLVAAVEARKG